MLVTLDPILDWIITTEPILVCWYTNVGNIIANVGHTGPNIGLDNANVGNITANVGHAGPNIGLDNHLLNQYWYAGIPTLGI